MTKKLTKGELIDLVEEMNQDENSLDNWASDQLYEEGSKNTFGGWKVETLGFFNSEGVDVSYHDGQSMIQVIKVTKTGDKDFKIHLGRSGYYTSHNGCETDGDWEQVELKEKTIKVWE